MKLKQLLEGMSADEELFVLKSVAKSLKQMKPMVNEIHLDEKYLGLEVTLQHAIPVPLRYLPPTAGDSMLSHSRLIFRVMKGKWTVILTNIKKYDDMVEKQFNIDEYPEALDYAIGVIKKLHS